MAITPWPTQNRMIGTIRPDVRVSLGGLDVTDYLLRMEIREALDGQASFAARFRDRDKWFPRHPSRMNPLYNWGAGPFSGKLRPHNWSYTNLTQISITVAGMPWQSCPFVLGSPDFDGQDLELTGLDPTHLLEEPITGAPGQPTFADIISDKDPPDVYYAHALLRAMLATKGITSVVFLFPDYRVRELKRGKGSILSWCRQVTRPYGALWGRWEGSTLILAPRQRLSGASAEWILIADHQIETLAPKFNDQIKTGVKVARLIPQAGQIGRGDCNNPDCPGIKSIQITPSRFVRGEVKYAINGSIKNVTFFKGGVNGTVVGIDLGDQNSISYQGSELADTVQFFYDVNFQSSGFGSAPIGAYTPGFEIVFWGGTGSADDLDSQYSAEFNDTDAEGVFRMQREEGAIEDPIVPNQTVASAYAEAYVRENVDKAWSCPFGTPYLNPQMRLGSCIGIVDQETNQQGQKWLIQERSLGLESSSRGAGFHGYMTGTLTKGPLD